MTTISLYHRGLGLWIDRGKYLEILFPNAERAADPYGMPLPAHYPVLKVAIRPTGTDGHVYKAYDLTNCVLDLMDLTVDDPRNKLGSPSFLLPIESSAAYDPARSEGLVEMGSQLVVGAVRLRPEQVICGKYTKSGVNYGELQNLTLSVGVNWKASNATGTHCRITNRVTGQIQDIELAPEQGTNEIALTIENLSFRDLYDQQSERPSKDEDFAAHYLLVPSAKRDLPDYKPVRVADGVPETRNDPEHLCPGSYLTIE